LLSEAGQRVYLLKADKLECYIEVIEVDKTSSALAGRSTLNFEAELSQLNGTIEQTINHVQSVEKVAHTNQQHIQNIESRLDTALDAIERVGKRPLIYLGGTVVLGMTVLSGIILFGLYSNMDKLVDTYIDHRYQKTQQQQQSK
jgi:high-affinity K+ transport system ATPase subunit B